MRTRTSLLVQDSMQQGDFSSISWLDKTSSFRIGLLPALAHQVRGKRSHAVPDTFAGLCSTEIPQHIVRACTNRDSVDREGARVWKEMDSGLSNASSKGRLWENRFSMCIPYAGYHDKLGLGALCLDQGSQPVQDLQHDIEVSGLDFCNFF